MRADNSVGKRIRTTREAKRISQNELAQLLGISAAAVCLWETKGTVPRIKTLKKVAEALGVTENYLSTGVESTTPTEFVAEDDSVAVYIEKAKLKIAEVTGIDIAKIMLKITFHD